MKSYTYHKIGKVTLTGREADCLAAMMLGLTIKQTADKLKLSTRTVEGYRRDLKKKFWDKPKSEIFMLAFRHKFPFIKFIKKFK